MTHDEQLAAEREDRARDIVATDQAHRDANIELVQLILDDWNWVERVVAGAVIARDELSGENLRDSRGYEVLQHFLSRPGSGLQDDAAASPEPSEENTTTDTTPDRSAAYREWHDAAIAVRLRLNDRTTAEEQRTWEAYVDTCTALGQCIEPSCTAPSPDHVYCDAHRGRDNT